MLCILYLFAIMYYNKQKLNIDVISMVLRMSMAALFTCYYFGMVFIIEIGIFEVEFV